MSRSKSPSSASLPVLPQSLGLRIALAALLLIGFLLFREPADTPVDNSATSPSPSEERRPIDVLIADEPANSKPDARSDSIPSNATKIADATPAAKPKKGDAAADETARIQGDASAREKPPTNPRQQPNAAKPPPRTEKPAGSGDENNETKRVVVRKMTIRDQSNRVVFEGDIDLTPTLERIEKGVRNEHRNDGSVFQNREGRLPKRPQGYYHEYVHPTPKISGPGPQRVVLGEQGEIFYTHDHYRTFRRLK